MVVNPLQRFENVPVHRFFLPFPCFYPDNNVSLHRPKVGKVAEMAPKQGGKVTETAIKKVGKVAETPPKQVGKVTKEQLYNKFRYA